MLFFYQSFLVFMSKIQKHIKSWKSISLIDFVEFGLKACFALYLCTLCIYECCLFPMHLYYSGRTFDIYVTVLNRSSNLSWMVSEWFCWSWDMYKLVPIYLPTYLFYCFCLKSSPNVNLQMKRDIELQKPVAHTSIWLEKRESDLK